MFKRGKRSKNLFMRGKRKIFVDGNCKVSIAKFKYEETIGRKTFKSVMIFGLPKSHRKLKDAQTLFPYAIGSLLDS